MDAPKNEFNWLEVVGIRLFNPCHSRNVSRFFIDFVDAARKGTGEITGLKLYSNASISSDWEIHIYRRSEEETPEKTGIGLRLAMELSSFGLVHHAVWGCQGISGNRTCHHQ